MKEDPLNFNLLSVVVEVIGAYGNVGFSMGYSCQRRSKPDASCKDASYGLAGRWSDKGKFILIITMLFGKLKKFNVKAGIILSNLVNLYTSFFLRFWFACWQDQYKGARILPLRFQKSKSIKLSN